MKDKGAVDPSCSGKYKLSLNGRTWVYIFQKIGSSWSVWNIDMVSEVVVGRRIGQIVLADGEGLHYQKRASQQVLREGFKVWESTTQRNRNSHHRMVLKALSPGVSQARCTLPCPGTSIHLQCEMSETPLKEVLLPDPKSLERRRGHWQWE